MAYYVIAEGAVVATLYIVTALAGAYGAWRLWKVD